MYLANVIHRFRVDDLSFTFLLGETGVAQMQYGRYDFKHVVFFIFGELDNIQRCDDVIETFLIVIVIADCFSLKCPTLNISSINISL